MSMILKKAYGALLSGTEAALGCDTAKKLDSSLRFRRRLNLKSPATLADKVSYIELHEQPPLTAVCTDKFAVRDYVAQKGYAHTLIPVVGGAWERVEQIDFDSLPDRFVLKATHGCKMNYPVPDKSKLDAAQCKKTLQRWLDTTYGTYSMEPHYKAIPHRLYAEAYLEETAGLVDYKIHCLNGVPRFILTVSDRIADGDKPMQATLDLFDTEWKPIFELVPSRSEVPGTGAVPRPGGLDKMCKMAADLAEDFKFVRVDLYELDGRIYFGEMTFSPACCVFPYFSDRFNAEMGQYLQI